MLSDRGILKAVEEKTIVIEPFDRECLGTNSYDLHLGDTLSHYDDYYLDAKSIHGLSPNKISQYGLLLVPGKFYLAATKEYTETHEHVPRLDGKSSVGRLGILIHYTAGLGDVGYCGFWTLEISVQVPVTVYAGMPIAQISYETLDSPPMVKYGDRPNSKYSNKDSLPAGSQMWRNFTGDRWK